MKNKFIVFFIMFIIMLCSYKQNDKHTFDNKLVSEAIKDGQPEESGSITVMVNHQNENKKLDLEDYVIGVVSCEMPASFEIEALKAMAVAARTYALYKLDTNSEYVLSSTTSDQCYSSLEKLKSRWKDKFESNYKRISLAVNETKGEYISYNDKPIYAAYFSISNGYTENSEDVFVKKLSYLKSVDSLWDKQYSYKEKSIEMTEDDFLRKLGISDKKIESIKFEKCSHGRVNYIYINGNKYKGTKIRSLLSLRSTDFTINNKDNKVIIHTKGYGHGVGMSQYGANGMAQKGYNYTDIINHYYTDVKMMNK